MSQPVSTADVVSVGSGASSSAGAASATGEASPDDGWRGGGLPALRAQLDRIDDAVHDLLMQRAEIVEHVARSGKPAAFRPGREASIIRRLLARHNGALPPVAVVRIWRELLAGTTTMQGGFSVAVAAEDESGASLAQLAREHFGALTPLRTYKGCGQALMDVSRGVTSVAVMPYPSDTSTWWLALIHHEPRLHIIGCLPFWRPRPDGAPAAQALVVANTPADASEEDQSLLGLECDNDVGQGRLASELARAGFKPHIMALVRTNRSPPVSALIRVEGYIPDEDGRLDKIGAVLRRPVVLGHYATPIRGGAR